MSETAERLMDLAEAHIRHRGYGGFSFRELAAEIGIKSASVHHHFPTKAAMAAAVARRYGDRFLAAVAAQPNERTEDAIAAYRSAFREALDRDGQMCLCGVLGAEAGALSPDVAGKFFPFSAAASTTCRAGLAVPMRKRGRSTSWPRWKAVQCSPVSTGTSRHSIRRPPDSSNPGTA